jgi:hypothetical protein
MVPTLSIFYTSAASPSVFRYSRTHNAYLRALTSPNLVEYSESSLVFRLRRPMLGAPNKTIPHPFTLVSYILENILSGHWSAQTSSLTATLTLTMTLTHQWGWVSCNGSPWPAWLARRVPCHIPQTHPSVAMSIQLYASIFSSQDSWQGYGCPDGCKLFAYR